MHKENAAAYARPASAVWVTWNVVCPDRLRHMLRAHHALSACERRRARAHGRYRTFATSRHSGRAQELCSRAYRRCRDLSGMQAPDVSDESQCQFTSTSRRACCARSPAINSKRVRCGAGSYLLLEGTVVEVGPPRLLVRCDEEGRPTHVRYPESRQWNLLATQNWNECILYARSGIVHKLKHGACLI